MRKLILLLPFIGFGQIQIGRMEIGDDIAHAYASHSINLTAYSVQKSLFPKQKLWQRLLVSNLITASALVGKEVYDMHKSNPTGFSKRDLINGGFQIPVFDFIAICFEDWKLEGFKPHKHKDKYVLER